MRKLLATTAVILALTASGAYAEMDGGHHGDFKAKFEESIAKLPEAKQALVKASFEKNRESHKADREQMKTLHEAMRSIMLAPTFDKAAYLAKANEIEALRAAQSKARAESMAELAGQLTAEERAILVDAMPKPGKWGHQSKGTDDEAPSE